MTANEPFVEVHETHSGVVVLYGDRAYKTKKPVSTAFLDFSSTAQRDAACRREITLNKRLAPDVYLGLGHLRSPGRDPEPIVVMRRMPEESKLARRLDAGGVVADEIGVLARTIAQFHRTAMRNQTIDSHGTASALRDRWTNNLVELDDLCAGQVDDGLRRQIMFLAYEYIEGRGVLLAERVKSGRIVDGHGDLLTDDIFFLADGPRILDCLDFDDHLRYLDGLDDAAFLAMDIEHRGHRSSAEEFMVAYTRVADDHAPQSLIDHYIAYRAVVRAKVDHLRAKQQRRSVHDEAHRHLELACTHLLRGRVRLGVLGGLPGTGKTTVATRLAEVVGAVLISSDVVRAELLAAGAISGPSGRFGEGLYSSANKAVVYGSMLERARSHLLGGRSVVLDGSWIDRREREFAAATAAETSSAVAMIRCVVDEETARQRIRNRIGGASEATPAIAQSMAETVRDELWQEAGVVDTGGSVDESVAVALRMWYADATPRMAR